MGQHGTFGTPSGAGGVEDRGRVLGGGCEDLFGVLAAAEQGPFAVGTERLDDDAGLFRLRPSRVLGGTLRAADQDTRTGIGEEVVHLGAGVGSVQRQEDPADLQCGQVQGQGFRRFLHLHRHAVTGAHPVDDEPSGDLLHQRIELRVAHRLPLGQPEQLFLRAQPDLFGEGGVDGRELVAHRAVSSLVVRDSSGAQEVFELPTQCDAAVPDELFVTSFQQLGVVAVVDHRSVGLPVTVL